MKFLQKISYLIQAVIILLGTILFLQTCQQNGENRMNKALFGKMNDGKEVFIFTITNKNGSEVKLTNYGATVVSLKVPDRTGKIENVVLGYPKLEDYIRWRHFLGAIVGRYGNRIANGKFSLNGVEYNLATNDGKNTLHGGNMGFDRVLWDVEELTDNENPALKFTYLSKDGEEGFPGNLQVIVIYTFSDNNELRIDYKLTTDKPTVINVTNHAYFNLSGDVKSDILGHELMLNADYFTVAGEGLIPTGEIAAVAGTPLDFTKPHRIGERIDDDYEQLKLGKGYDHNWILNGNEGELKHAGFVYEPVSGRKMDVYTTEPAIQFYSGNFMDGSDSGREGFAYEYRHALCLETQHYPDSPNHENFPTTVLNPGAMYKSTTIYRFSIGK